MKALDSVRGGLRYIRGRRRALLFLFVSCLAVYYPLLSADFYYRDDLRRAATGFRGWGYGRYLSLLGSVLLHGDTYLADISPLPQVLAALLTAVSSLALLAVFGEGWRREEGTAGEKWQCMEGKQAEESSKLPLGFSVPMLVSALLAGIYPCFLNCICYKYDAPYMALSVLFGIAPLFFYSFGSRGLFYGFLCFLGTLGVCLTYQASSGILPMLTAFLVLLRWGRGEKLLPLARFALVSAAGYLLGLLTFRVFVVPEETLYVSAELPGLSAFLANTAGNLAMYGGRFFGEMRPLWVGALSLLLLGFGLVYAGRARRGRVLSFAVYVLALPVLLVLSLGAYPYLEKPLFLPRAMYGIGVLFSLCAMGLASEGRWKRIRALLPLALAGMFTVFSFTLGNALDAQAEYTRFRTAEVIEDLASFPEVIEGKAKVQLKGNIGFAPLIEAMPEDYGMVRRIVPYTLKGGYLWGEYGFFHYYGLGVTKTTGLKKKEMKLLSETLYHRIYGKDGAFLIELTKGGQGG